MQELPNRKSPRANRYDYTSTGVYFVTVCTWDHEEYFGKIIDGKMVLNEIGRICDEELQTMLQKRPSVDLHAYVIMPNHVHLLLCVDECRDDGLPRPNSEGVICPNIHPKGVICPNVHPEGVICPNIQNDLNGSTTQNYITLDSNRVVVWRSDRGSMGRSNRGLMWRSDRGSMWRSDRGSMWRSDRGLMWRSDRGSMWRSDRGSMWRSDRASPVPTTNITNQTLWTIIGWRKSAVSRKCRESWYQFVRQSRYHDHIVRNEEEYDNIQQYIQNNPEKWTEDHMYVRIL